MGIIGILLLIIICGFIFYKYLMSKFVHFMNTFILVPPQRLINNIIKAVNKIIEGINKPFKSLHFLSIGASLGKIFGKRIGFSIQPFKDIIPQKLVPHVPGLKYQCISEPDGYKNVFGYSTPKECIKPAKKKKTKKVSEKTSGILSNFIILLIIALFVLFYMGNQTGFVDAIKSKVGVLVVPDVVPAGLSAGLSVPGLSAGLSVPTLPVPTLPAVPAIPVPALPAIPVPGLSVPALPASLPVPGLSAVVPTLPTLPVPTLPTD